MMNRKVIKCIGIVILIGLIGCSRSEAQTFPAPTEIDPEDVLKIIRMSDNICDLPCWMGITPMETTYEETLEILRRLEFFTIDGYILKSDDQVTISWVGGDGNGAYFRFEDGTVSLIEFWLRGNKLGHVIQTYGNPEYYTTVRDGDGYGMDVLYPQTGLVFESGGRNKIRENVYVSGVFYVAPGPVEEFFAGYVSHLRSVGSLSLDFNGEYYPWEGLGVCPRGLTNEYLCEE